MENWRQIQKNNFRDWETLFSFLKIKSPPPIFTSPSFPLNLPRRLARKIEKNNLNDPLLRQFIPSQNETKDCKGFIADPLSENSFQKTNRLLQKYQGRVLILTTNACAMHCRFCFRQNYPYQKPSFDFQAELDIIKADSTIQEVILSGGDPLSLSNQVLSSLIASLSQISHLKLLRFHTRFPIGIPERFDASFLKIVASCPLQVVFVFHINHSKELDELFFEKVKALQKRGVLLLTHTVLLKGVNDNVETLKTLFLNVVQKGIVPYYLHQLDPVKGSFHFEVPLSKGLDLVKQLRKILPGYAVPSYVRETPYHPYKTPLI